MKNEVHQFRVQKQECPLKVCGSKSLLIAVVFVIALLAQGCSNLKPLPPLERRVAVLDFSVPPDVATTGYQVKGWFLSSYNVFQNPEAGAMFGDALARNLSVLEYIEQHSRMDVKIFTAKKRRLFESEFAGMAEADYAKMMQMISPVDYAEQLGVEEVLTGRIIECYTEEHRIFAWWRSRVKVEVDLWDVESGRVIWSDVFEGKRCFYSQSKVMHELAPKIVEALDKNHYQQQGRPASR